MSDEEPGFTLSAEEEVGSDTASMPRAQRDHTLRASRSDAQSGTRPALLFAAASAALLGLAGFLWRQHKRRKEGAGVVQVDVSKLCSSLEIKPPPPLAPPSPAPGLAGLKFLLSKQ